MTIARVPPLPAVQSPEVGGVTMRRYAMDLEAASLLAMARKIRKRLMHAIRMMPAQRVAMHKTKEGYEPVLDEHLKPVMIAYLPDEEWRENAKWYSKSLMELLREQRERAKLAPKNGGAQVDDETFNAELLELGRQALREMSPAELRKLVAEREALDTTGTEVLVSTNHESRDDE